MNGLHEERFTLNWGCLVVTAILSIGGVVIVVTLGWRWLWLVPVAAVAIWVLTLVSTILESRWRAVTPEHVERGVPPLCTACGEEWSAVFRARRFRARCPICGHQEKGVLLP